MLAQTTAAAIHFLLIYSNNLEKYIQQLSSEKLLKNMPSSAGAIAVRSVKRANPKLSRAVGVGNGRAVDLNVCRRKSAWGLKAAGEVATLTVFEFILEIEGK